MEEALMAQSAIRNLPAGAAPQALQAGPQSAILLLGPTGSGKTPLGDWLGRHGLWGRRCVHFDFGERLRKAAGSPCGQGLADHELGVVRHSLQTGALLEDKDFGIAVKILKWFLDEVALERDGVVVLNGLPRHVGQAGDIERILDVQWVFVLACAPDVVRERIRLDSGGDRAGRADDSAEEIERKLALFRERTAPMLDQYCEKGASIQTLEIGITTTPEELAARIRAWGEIHCPSTPACPPQPAGRRRDSRPRAINH